MAQGTYQETVLFEHRFWLQVLGDHARFIYHALSPNETEDIRVARQFINAFDQALHQSRRELSGDALNQLTKAAEKAAGDLRVFKLNLLRRQLTGDISIGLAETFINHMVNELDEYLRILSFLAEGKVPPKVHPIHHHLLWVSDAGAHAGIITSSLDVTERKLKEKGKAFEEDFHGFYLKAIEIAGYLRTNIYQFPALSRYNSDVRLELKVFRGFLAELEEWGLSKELLGTFTPLMADHMAREECYYLMQLAESDGTPPPSCDPTKPRVTTASMS
ncbi:DUF2935 family protein [Scopulibacillus darangshiensis]|uniref:DUF2935 family protein n=1 Tax=Scopulibacillus darangshiensis TaxID=442528 RepID=A0A4R2P6V0_9BACL|nr:DUF2935 domain-containing protein [Scopulibacillus darangshiensis]TCP30592.1 DUF2935 family protein [Scopulibacillus darangshiensis]